MKQAAEFHANDLPNFKRWGALTHCCAIASGVVSDSGQMEYVKI
jgi:hypothetical protein